MSKQNLTIERTKRGMPFIIPDGVTSVTIEHPDLHMMLLIKPKNGEKMPSAKEIRKLLSGKAPKQLHADIVEMAMDEEDA